MEKSPNGKSNKRIRIAFTAAGILLAAAVVCSLCVGKYPLSPGRILRIIFGGEATPMERRVFLNLRLSRTLLAALGGAGLAVSGYVFQTVFRNPLASPDIIGVSSGANLGAAFAILSMGTSGIATIVAGAFTGGILSVLAVLLLVKLTGSKSTSTYVLSGIILSAVSSAGIMALKYFADAESQLATMEYWSMGSLSAVTMRKFAGILAFWTIGFLGTVLFRRQIGLLSLSEDEARSLGVAVGPVRVAVLLLSTLLVSSVISVTGLISFSGLIAPHIAKLILRRSTNETLFFSAVVGADVMVLADILARSLYSAELPISILTTAIGVPVLVIFLVKKREEGERR